MQNIGYILISDKKIKVLFRTDLKTYVALKLRKSGKDGNLLVDESIYLSENPSVLKRLLNGEAIKL